MSLTATNRLRANLMLHCLRLDLSFHTAHNPRRADRARGRAGRSTGDQGRAAAAVGRRSQARTTNNEAQIAQL
ncbi:MAG: hypothetical protein H7Y32_05280 [Chloroflexales bacterium]|nr:hypothetical protein [Chloroflexales bacterium]